MPAFPPSGHGLDNGGVSVGAAPIHVPFLHRVRGHGLLRKRRNLQVEMASRSCNDEQLRENCLGRRWQNIGGEMEAMRSPSGRGMIFWRCERVWLGQGNSALAKR